jgi:hypothetical protein
MARNRRPGSSKQTFRQEQAALRRGAPGGRRFVGDANAQRERAVRAEREKVQRMAEVDHAQRTAERIGVPVIALVASIVQDAVHIAGVLVRLPFLLARAYLAPREAEA